MACVTRRLPAAVLLAALLLPGGAARAHETDPRVVTTLEAVEPALPPGVVVQVQAGLATQLVAQNPTSTVLEVLGGSGRPFLRISRAGVEADVGSEEFFTTSSPSGATPREAKQAPARWVRISSGDSWGWYDHRLHPTGRPAPADEQRAAALAEFQVPLRYGDQPVVVRGRVVFRPLLGAFLVSADPAPPGLRVQALPGRLPGVFLTAQVGHDVEVRGRDGEPFLRITDRGVEVNVRSRTHVEDRAARGAPAGPPATTTEFRLLGPGARSWTWLDARLRYPAELPPQPALTADGPTRLQGWALPVAVDGVPGALTGAISWVPEPAAAERVSGQRREVAVPADRLPYVLALGAGALLSTVLVLRRRRPRR